MGSDAMRQEGRKEDQTSIGKHDSARDNDNDKGIGNVVPLIY